MKNENKIFELSMLVAFILTVILSICSFETSCKDIEKSVLRLHVIANSDSDQDQELKLSVRDALLKEGADVFGGSETKLAAQEKIKREIPRLKSCAERIIKEKGFDYPVTILVEKAFFPTRTYEEATLPAGEYDAVRVLIGEAKGKNWWCVMFPPLCLPAAQSKAQLDSVLDSEGLALTKESPKYEIRFWIVEKLTEIKNHYNRK